MDFVLEVIGEFVLGGMFYTSANKKISKWIRYPLAAILIFLYVSFVVLFTIFAFFLMNKENIFVGLMILALPVGVVVRTIWLINQYKKKKEMQTTNE